MYLYLNFSFFTISGIVDVFTFNENGLETKSASTSSQMFWERFAKIYETKTDQPFNAKFCSYGKLNFYVFTPNITIAPSLSVRTIVHETAHAIQDWKEWRESSLDREVDAHFAEALYLVLSGKEKEAQNDLGMAYYIIAAQEYKENPKYLASLGFRKMRQKLKQETFQHYQFMNSLITPNFDVEKFNKAFNKKNKMDGIP